MKFALAVSALAATTAAAPELQKRQGTIDTVSVLQVLETALPSSLIQLAITNSGAASSEIASEFAAGSTPTWFTALPTDVQSYLVGPAAASATASGASALTSALGTVPVTPGGTPKATPVNTPGGTSPGSPGSPTTPTPTPGSSGSSGSGSSSGSGGSGGSGGSSGTGGSGSSAGGRSSSASTGGVPAQTVAVGMGMAGFAAAVGVLML